MTAGVIVLGLVVAYSVLGDSHVYLVETFEDLNAELEQNNQSVAQLEETSDARK